MLDLWPLQKRSHSRKAQAAGTDRCLSSAQLVPHRPVVPNRPSLLPRCLRCIYAIAFVCRVCMHDQRGDRVPALCALSIRSVTRVAGRAPGHFAFGVVARTGCLVDRGRTGFRRRPLQTKRAAAERVIPARRAPLQRDGSQVRRFLAHRKSVFFVRGTPV